LSIIERVIERRQLEGEIVSIPTAPTINGESVSFLVFDELRDFERKPPELPTVKIDAPGPENRHERRRRDALARRKLKR
jgi:hypothetical protein